MLVAALVDLGRDLRCGDDGIYARLSADLHGRYVCVAGIRLLLELSSAPIDGRRKRRRQRTGRKAQPTFQDDDLQPNHALDRDGDRDRLSILSASVHQHLRLWRRSHGRHEAVVDHDIRHDVTYVSAGGREGHQISTGRAGG